MTENFLDHLLKRTLTGEPPIRPRPSARFEPADTSDAKSADPVPESSQSPEPGQKDAVRYHGKRQDFMPSFEPSPPAHSPHLNRSTPVLNDYSPIERRKPADQPSPSVDAPSAVTTRAIAPSEIDTIGRGAPPMGAVSTRSEGGKPPRDATPTVTVTIGRVELKAVAGRAGTPARRETPKPTNRKERGLTLDDYLASRGLRRR